MEEKKGNYSEQILLFKSISMELGEQYQLLTNAHSEIISNSSVALKKIFDKASKDEVIHYQSLNILAPEKSNVIKNQPIKFEPVNESNLQTEKFMKISMQRAKDDILQLPAEAATYQAVVPYCQVLYDSNEHYSKIAEQWIKYIQFLLAFFHEVCAVEKSMSKFFKENDFFDKKKLEQYPASTNFGNLVEEQHSLEEQKEKSH